MHFEYEDLENVNKQSTQEGNTITEEDEPIGDWYWIIRIWVLVMIVTIAMVLLNILIGVLGNAYNKQYALRRELFNYRRGQAVFSYNLGRSRRWEREERRLRLQVHPAPPSSQDSNQTKYADADFLWYCTVQPDQEKTKAQKIDTAHRHECKASRSARRSNTRSNSPLSNANLSKPICPPTLAGASLPHASVPSSRDPAHMSVDQLHSQINDLKAENERLKMWQSRVLCAIGQQVQVPQPAPIVSTRLDALVEAPDRHDTGSIPLLPIPPPPPSPPPELPADAHIT